MHDHDDDDFLIWLLLAPEGRGWRGFVILVLWALLGFWWFYG